MTLKLEVISHETIKPSFRTPDHLRSFKLSLLDQCSPSAHVPFILYYTANHNEKVQNKERVDYLKKSLSDILTLFHPLAGRISDNLIIDCNDEGISFSEAQVSCYLKQICNNPIADELDQLLPNTDKFYASGPKVLLSIQVNIFECGGIALGVCIAHKVADASSLNLFLHSWAALARGDKQVLQPKFYFASTFPPHLNLASLPITSAHKAVEKLISKRFVFDFSNTGLLKEKCSSNLDEDHPTRVEAVFAFIWNCALNAVRMRSKCVKSTSAVIAMNLRGKMVPSLSDIYFGNAVLLPLASSSVENTKDAHSLVGPLRDAMRKIDQDFVKNLHADHGCLEHYDSVAEANNLHIKGELEHYVFTSWLRFSFYETDFGWGKPVWVSTANWDWKNIVVLIDTKCGKGVEAWVTMNEEDMGRFECDTDLHSFTSTMQLFEDSRSP